MNYYPRHVGDYWRDAHHLSMLEHGAFTCLMDRYYSDERGIPDERKYRLAHATTDDERAAVDMVLNEFFTLKDGVWINGRCETEISASQARAARASEHGKYGGRPRKEKPNPSEKETQPFSTENPTLSVEKPNPFENETQEKANQKPKAKSQKPNNNPLPPEGEPPPPSGTPHWWEIHDDALVRSCVAEVRASHLYADFEPDEARFLGLIEFVRNFAPDDTAISDTFESFRERAAGRKRREYADPIRTLREWFKRREAEWRQIRRQREIDARRASPQKSGSVLDFDAVRVALGVAQ